MAKKKYGNIAKPLININFNREKKTPLKYFALKSL